MRNEGKSDQTGRLIKSDDGDDRRHATWDYYMYLDIWRDKSAGLQDYPKDRRNVRP